MRFFLLIAVVGLVLAGCVTPPGDLTPNDAPSTVKDLEGSVRIPPPDKDLSKAIVSDHGAPYLHAVPQLHGGSYRMDLVGYNPLTNPLEGDHPLVQNSAYTAVTLWNDTYACISHFAGTGGAGGATIVDITDPAKLRVVSSIPDLKVGSRCQFTPDGKFLLAGAYTGVHGGIAPLGGLGLAGADGVSVYDMSDAKNPKFVANIMTGVDSSKGDAYHNFDMEIINGTTYVFQTYTANILTLAPDGKTMTLVSQVDHMDHDMWVGKHPITGVMTLVTGAGAGTIFYDITDPATPVVQGVYEGNKTYQGWHRQWPLDDLVNGKAIMIVAGEECGNGKSLPYTVLDWSDPTDVKVMGHWQVPGNPEIREPGQLCSMNSHEFNTWNGYVATGNYHAGVWIFDVGSEERLWEPVTIGYYEPHEVPQQHGGVRNTPFAWSPDVWTAYFDSRGYVYAADWSTGFYALKFPGTPEP